LKAGFEATTAPVLGYIDADLQTYPEDFELLLAHIEDHALVTGRRVTRQDSAIKRFSSKFGNSVRRMFTQDNMNDTGCPLKIIRTDYAKKIPLFAGLQRFLPAMILLQDGKIIEVPINHYPRLEGESKYGFNNRFIGPLIDCFAYVWMKKTYIKYEIEEKG
jgi:glycosyltransferase involved in cell wall biosynthesis